MRFVIEIPDELVAGTEPAVAPSGGGVVAPTYAVPDQVRTGTLSGGAAPDAAKARVRPLASTLFDALSAGPAEGGTGVGAHGTAQAEAGSDGGAAPV